MTKMEQSWTQVRLDIPGAGFSDSFLLGNGFFGASVGFQPATERVLLSHTAFWSGSAPETHGRRGAVPAFQKARKLSLQGDHGGAYDALKDFIGEKENYGTNLPVGCLVMEQQLPAAEAYCRGLNLITGEAWCAFTHGGARQTRTARCLEHPRVLEIEFRDTERMQITFSLEGECITGRKEREGFLLFEAKALETVHSDGEKGISLLGGLAVSADGSLETGPGCIHAEGHAIRLYLSMETDYTPGTDELPPTRAAMENTVLKTLQECLRREPEKGNAADLLPIRVELEGEERINRQVLFGHYLLRSALTRESPLPPNLQGVWNDGEACRLGWTNDFHLDVNTQMNLWCAETLGDGDRLVPLFRFMLQRLIPEGRKTARGYYGLPGAVAELSTNCFGYAAPYWGRPLAPCPACGFWLCGMVVRHALCHQEDLDFLRKTALPILEPYVRFALAYVTDIGGGQLAGGPAISPENGFLSGGRTVYASMGTLFENEQMRILLEGYAKVCRLLGIENDMVRQAEETARWLPRARIGSRGEIGEYAHELPSAVPHHRHMSHLSGLYPGWSIRPGTPEADAAERTIWERIEPEEAFESTPWARVMLALYEARLGHGEQALAHLEAMMDCHGSPSMLLMHPAIPGTENPRPVWELDGNTGFAEAVLEMLVQAPEGKILLLPALPECWRKGRICGIQAGPWRLKELSWEMPGRIRLILQGQPGTAPEIHWNGQVVACMLPESGERTLDEKHFQCGGTEEK